MKKIVIGADHRGFELKKFLLEQHTIGSQEIQWIDVGTKSSERTDFPLYAVEAVKKILAHEAELGILICASGVGMSIAANRFKHIYAALVWNERVAGHARAHDNANVLVLPADYVSTAQAPAIIAAWLNAKFLGGRYANRLCDLDLAT